MSSFTVTSARHAFHPFLALRTSMQERAKIILPSLLFVSAVMAQVLLGQANAQEAPDSLQAIGEVSLVKGVVTARSSQRGLTALAKGSPIYVGDIVETATRSFTVLTFTDGGKITLRPESRFDMNEYDAAAGQEKKSFELIKGGLRAVSGAIGKARPQEVKYTARNTTIGIRGTTFVVRLCNEGEEGCHYRSDGETLSDEVSNEMVDIFIVSRKGGQRKKITRKELNDILNGIYISVVEGALRISNDQWVIDMGAGDKCLVDSSDIGLTEGESLDDVECFVNTVGLEDLDSFLRGDAEEIPFFNLFDDGELNVGSQLCEIN